jgi:hypothetical protein
MLGPQQQRILLLVFCTPDLEDRERVVSNRDLANFDPSAGGIDDLLEYVTVASRSSTQARMTLFTFCSISASPRWTALKSSSATFSP